MGRFPVNWGSNSYHYGVFSVLSGPQSRILEYRKGGGLDLLSSFFLSVPGIYLEPKKRMVMIRSL